MQEIKDTKSNITLNEGAFRISLDLYCHFKQLTIRRQKRHIRSVDPVERRREERCVLGENMRKIRLMIWNQTWRGLESCWEHDENMQRPILLGDDVIHP